MRRALLLGLGAAAGALAVRRIRRRAVDLEGRVALVTGSSRGLGLVLARELGSRGCRVVICARSEEELDLAREDLECRGIEVLSIPCDLTRPDDVDGLVEAILAEWGRLDVVINNAGVIQVGPLGRMAPEDFEAAMDVNFRGMLHTTLACLPALEASGQGRIANVTSIGGVVPVPHLLPYVCSKYAAVGLSEGLRTELASRGVSVTTVVPGLMRTGSPPNAWFRGDVEKEFAWFSLGDSLRLTATSAEAAARSIVDAMASGKAFVTLTWQAKLLRGIHAVAPGLTAEVLGVVNRLLPSADEGEERREDPVRGRDVERIVPRRLTRLMDQASVRNNELAAEPGGWDA